MILTKIPQDLHKRKRLVTTVVAYRGDVIAVYKVSDHPAPAFYPAKTARRPKPPALMRARSARQCELTPAQLEAILDYVRALAPPARRNPDEPSVKQGEALFATNDCATSPERSSPLAPLLPAPLSKERRSTSLYGPSAARARRRSEAWASPENSVTPPIFSATGARAASPRRSSGTAKKRKRLQMPFARFLRKSAKRCWLFSTHCDS